MPISAGDEARAEDSRVRIAGKPLCTTTNSRSLDADVDGRASFVVRDWAAERIALCWNACRHLSDEQLHALAKPEQRP